MKPARSAERGFDHGKTTEKKSEGTKRNPPRSKDRGAKPLGKATNRRAESR